MQYKKVYTQSAKNTERLVKTSLKNRDTYVYTFVGEESIGDKKRTYIEKYTLISGEDGVNEENIKKLHSLDDHDTYANLKVRHPQRTPEEKQQIAEWKAEYIRSFTEKYGYEPHPADVEDAANEKFPKNWTLSLDELADGDGEDDDSAIGDKSSILAKACHSCEKEPGIIEKMDEIAAAWQSDSWKEIYRRVLRNHETIVSVAKDRGVSEGAVRKTVEKIKKTFAENPELKKFIRFFC